MRRGLILAGGAGTRLHPLTLATSKQLLPVYNKPMIYYPLSVLMLAGVREILVITTPDDQGAFKRLLGDGARLGLSLTYAAQAQPEGLADAYRIGEAFVAGEPSCLVLGDNIFYGSGFSAQLKRAAAKETGAVVFGYPVADPGRYGVVELDAAGAVVSLVEKPDHPRSNVALKPSARGELEILDLIGCYQALGELSVEMLGRGFAWLDTGTHDALIQAGEFVRAIEARQGLRLGCVEEIAFQNGWIDRAALKALATASGPYGAYLAAIAEDGA
jgi:glucose-1-phosphate thymidylyltransferase